MKNEKITPKALTINSNTANVLSLLLIAVTLLIAYANTFHSPFYFDDYGYVIGNASVEINSLSFANLKKAALESPGTMRALANVSFALNHYFNGKEVFGFHLVNLLVHLATAITVYLLFVKTLTLGALDKRPTYVRGVALVSALLWAVHPLHTNSVTYIIQRMTSMAALFFLLSILLYAHGATAPTTTRRLSFWAASLLSGCMAIFSKENALMLPVMLIAYHIFFISEFTNQRQIKKTLTLTIIGAVTLLGLLFLLQGESIRTFLAKYANKEFSMAQRLLTEPRVIVFYLSLMALPLPSRLNLFHDFPLSYSLISPPQTVAAIATLAVLVSLTIWLFKQNRLLSFTIFWFLGNLVIESSFLPLALIFEHRTYLPSVFIPLSLVILTCRYLENQKIRLTLAIVTTLILMVCTWQRNHTWTNTLTFWTDVTEKSPSLSRGHLGVYFAQKALGRNIEARQSLIKAFEADNSDEKAMNNLFNDYLAQKQLPAAIAVTNKFLAKKQTHDAYINRAKAHALLKEFAKTSFDAEQAIKLKPKSALAWLIKGKALSSLNSQKAALEALSTAQKLGLRSAILFASIGESYLNIGNIELAIHHFTEALKIDPDHASSHYYLGMAYSKKGLATEAKTEMDRGIYLMNNPSKKKYDPHAF